jgi:branched-chain amino acid transport system permease protein
LRYINPGSFTIIKSTEMLVMVYLGGVGSLGGSILGATIFTVVIEGLRSLLAWVHIGAEWRQVVVPLLLILLMLFRPRGIMGMREFPFLVPLKERFLRRKRALVETTAEEKS